MDKIRNGNFTSSEIFCLMGGGTRKMTDAELSAREKGNKRTTIDVYFGDKALTYIKQTNWERKLGRSLEKETNTMPLVWGKIVEYFAFNQLGLEYKHCSQETLQHPNIPYWVGSPDGQKFDEDKTVVEFKCPELATFCELSECKTIDEVKENHKDGEKYYWQTVSNAIITGSKFAELIVFLPFQSQLQEIRDMINDKDIVGVGEEYKYFKIANANDEELVFLPDEGCQYSNIHIIRWEVSEADKAALTERVIEAGKLLLPE